MSGCVFCKIARGEEWAARVMEDDEHIAFMDRYPASIGHTLVAPKRHFKDIFEMDEDSISRLYAVVYRVALAVKETLNAEGINILQNNGAAAGQVIFHVHVHVIPRSSSEHLLPGAKWRRINASREELLETASRISEKMVNTRRYPSG